MSGRCRHNLRYFEIAVVFAPHESSARSGAFGPGWGNVVGQCRCNACGEVLPLGHSDETPERVAVEIRAAQIAENGTPFWCEACGWDAHQFGTLPAPYPTDKESEFHAGYLARVIATHKETP